MKRVLEITRQAISSLDLIRQKVSIEQKEELLEVMFQLAKIKEIIQENESLQGLKPTKINKKERIKNKDKVYIVACYVSRFGHEGLYRGLNQTETLKKIAEAFSMKFTSFKGTRDIFDPYFDNGRKGWVGRPLNKLESKIYNKYKKTYIVG